MEENESTPKYHVYDRQTGQRANRTEYKSKMGARRAVDRLDNDYGAYRYYVKPAETSTKGMGSSMGGGGGGSRGGGGGGSRGGGGGGGGGAMPDIDKLGKNPLNMEKGGSVKSSASKRADGCAMRGKTRGRMV